MIRFCRHRFSRSNYVFLLGSTIACIAFTGCAVHRPTLERPPRVAATQTYHEATREITAPQPPTERWWEAFNDPVLMKLIDTALRSNLDLSQLAARVQQARAFTRQQGARRLPTIDAGVDYESTWTDPSGDGHSHDELLSGGLLLNWELDVWGRLRAAEDAAELDAKSAHQDFLAAQLILAANVADTYFEALEQRLQLQLLAEQIVTNNTLLELTRLRFGQGQSSIVDVLQQREQLASTRALVPLVEARLAELEYALDVLLGRAPGNRERLKATELPALAALPDVGVPAALLETRPDLVASRHRMDAIDLRIGEAIADRFPRFNIGGAVAATGSLRPDTLVSSVFAGALAPLFDGGERRAAIDFRRAQWEEAVAGYAELFLTAVKEVETAILRERQQARRVRLQEDQLDTARQLLSETRNRYSQGLTDYLPVLAAVATEQDLERALITSRRLELTSRVALHLALGGPLTPRELMESQASRAAGIDPTGRDAAVASGVVIWNR